MTPASIEETSVVVVPHDPQWSRLYAVEAERVRTALGSRCSAVEHIGSTAVPGLSAKPIVDILAASIDGSAPSTAELDVLAALSYVFLGEDRRRPGRWFWRKRETTSFNLSIVPVGSALWHDNLLLRDYLRCHPAEAQRYAEIKRRAVEAFPRSLLGYQDFKRDFMRGLKARAVEWRHRMP